MNMLLFDWENVICRADTSLAPPRIFTAVGLFVLVTELQFKMTEIRLVGDHRFKLLLHVGLIARRTLKTGLSR